MEVVWIPFDLTLENRIEANKVKVTKSIANQAQVISELEEEILTGANDLVEGFLSYDSLANSWRIFW